jgi:PTH1 family peptidyl-tRNA hydrolase
MVCDHLVLGLGNPGPRYAFTRHNAGFICLDLLAQEFKGRFSDSQKGLGKKINADTCEISIDSKKVLLIKPQTFMNLSGESLRALFFEGSHYQRVPLTVVHDEIDLDFGKVKIKKGGGDAGHNGLASIRAHLGNGDFLRVRLGVGKPAPESPLDVPTWVLTKFEKSEEQLLIDMLANACAGIESLVKHPDNLQLAQTLVSQEKRKLK